MKKYLLLYKPLGLSPQQAIEAYRGLHPEYQSCKLGSAGRLDPMAAGLLVIMVGDENKNQAQYIGLDKTYEVELLLGVSTDSYDLLGLITQPLSQVDTLNPTLLDSTLATKTGEILQPYPPYSAVRVQGKPLYWWTRQSRLNEIMIPTARRHIYGIKLLGIQSMSLPAFTQELEHRLGLVRGDFRQIEIMSAWKTSLNLTTAKNLIVLKLEVACSSGTFMRGLANQIGQELGCGAVAHSITRTKIGPWDLKDAETLPA